MKIKFDSVITKILMIIIISWIVLAIIFGIFDLEISIAVVKEVNYGWGNFGADYGEAPGWSLIMIAIAVVSGSLHGHIKKQKIPAFIIIFIGLMLFLIGIVDYDEGLIIFGISIFGPIIAFLALTLNKNYKDYRTIALIILILAVINPLIFVQIVKPIWGRVRFRDLSNNYSNYTPWFIINGYTGNQSFPSGHTAMAAMFLPILILVKGRKWKDPIKVIICILTIGWILFVGASRVVIGAHYASDVLFSLGMASIVTILLYKKFYQNAPLKKIQE